jgi:formamidopyrimidine-DNA glycosylase
MPELPEVEALKDFLTENLVGHEIVRVLPVAIGVPKTYDPPVTALQGAEVTAVHRYGTFLDVVTDRCPHLVTHLARAGRPHGRDRLPDAPPRPGKGPLALRVALETGAGCPAPRSPTAGGPGGAGGEPAGARLGAVVGARPSGRRR